MPGCNTIAPGLLLAARLIRDEARRRGITLVRRGGWFESASPWFRTGCPAGVEAIRREPALADRLFLDQATIGRVLPSPMWEGLSDGWAGDGMDAMLAKEKTYRDWFTIGRLVAEMEGMGSSPTPDPEPIGAGVGNG